MLTASLQPLQVQVSDGLHNSSVLLEIRLTDVNDRDPEFNSSLQYSADVPEVSLKFYSQFLQGTCMLQVLTSTFGCLVSGY